MRFNRLLRTMFVTGITLFACENDASVDSLTAGQGQGGSMTRFAISGNYLYLLDASFINVFDIAAAEFKQVKQVGVAMGLMETIFARGEYLYLGAADAMYIYSISTPAEPSFVFRYQHLVSCDPVVVQGDRAYVTLRSGTTCNRGANALEIIDISDPYNPVLIANYPMSSPHGLGVDGTALFICEGSMGLKVFNISDERAIKLVEHRNDFFAYDVIARNGLATVTGEDGIFQFSYGPEHQLLPMSKIPVTRTDR